MFLLCSKTTAFSRLVLKKKKWSVGAHGGQPGIAAGMVWGAVNSACAGTKACPEKP